MLAFKPFKIAILGIQENAKWFQLELLTADFIRPS